MKILFYINVFNRGGAERVMSVLANHFAKNDNQVVLVNSFKVDNEYQLDKKIKHLYLDNNDFNSRFQKNHSRITRLRKILKQEKPDVAISFMAEPNFRLLLASAFLKTKTIISIRNDPEKEYCGRVLGMAAKLLFRFADGVVFQTDDAKKWFPTEVQKKSEIIINPVDDSFYSVSYCSTKNIVSIGRLTDQKNQKMLISAFSKIASKTSENLYIYGEGPLEKELRKYINDLGMNDRIFLPGIVTDVKNVLSSAKLFVLSSKYEGMPNSLMEAMAVGVPCISSDCPCGGPRMLLNGELNVLLYNTEDENSLADLLLKLINDKGLCKKYSDLIKKRALSFKTSSICSEWAKFIESVR